jgi:hypothetical protein
MSAEASGQGTSPVLPAVQLKCSAVTYSVANESTTRLRERERLNTSPFSRHRRKSTVQTAVGSASCRLRAAGGFDESLMHDTRRPTTEQATNDLSPPVRTPETEHTKCALYRLRVSTLRPPLETGKTTGRGRGVSTSPGGVGGLGGEPENRAPSPEPPLRARMETAHSGWSL